MRRTLASLGFEVALAPGFANKPEMTTARFAPRHVPQRPAGRVPPGPPQHGALPARRRRAARADAALTRNARPARRRKPGPPGAPDRRLPHCAPRTSFDGCQQPATGAR